MTCTQRSLFYQATVCSGGTSTPRFNPITDRLLTSKISEARPRFYVESTSGANVSIVVAIRYSDDGVTWDAASTVGATETSPSGWIYRPFAAVGDTKRYMQFGASVATTTGSRTESVSVSAYFDFKN